MVLFYLSRRWRTAGRESITKIFLVLVCAPALVHVAREPVRALARLAAKPGAVGARNACVPAAAAILERGLGVRSGLAAHRTRPLLTIKVSGHSGFWNSGPGAGCPVITATPGESDRGLFYDRRVEISRCKVGNKMRKWRGNPVFFEEGHSWGARPCDAISLSMARAGPIASTAYPGARWTSYDPIDFRQGAYASREEKPQAAGSMNSAPGSR